MSMSDPLGDMLTRIRNGQNARKSVVCSPASRFRSNVLEVLKREGYIRNYSSVDIRPGLKELKSAGLLESTIPNVKETGEGIDKEEQDLSENLDQPELFEG